MDAQIACFNGWDNSIKVTHESDEDPQKVHFLDVEFCIKTIAASSTCCASYQTYRKPRCLYTYTPFNSNHSIAVKKGIIMTELTRLLRTNSSSESYNRNVKFFFQKLARQGYPLTMMQEMLRQRQWECKNLFMNRKPKMENDNKIVPFKIPYFHDAERFKFTSTIYKNAWLIQDILRSIKVVTCFTANANLFRLRYFRFLPSFQFCPGDGRPPRCWTSR